MAACAGRIRDGFGPFVIAGILPEVAGGVHVSVSVIGKTVTVLALTHVRPAPILPAAPARVPPRPLLLPALGRLGARTSLPPQPWRRAHARSSGRRARDAGAARSVRVPAPH